MRRLSTWLACLVVLATWRVAPADEVRLGVPVGGTVQAEGDMRWRDATGARGQGRQLRPGAWQGPVYVRGPESARSAGGAFPLPAKLVRWRSAWYALVELALNDYLAGVVGAEMSASWPMEALKAQAVLARTFARRRLANPRAGAPFDLVAGSLDQAYRWRSTHPNNLRDAVRATGRRVLRRRDGTLAEVFFHACSGGHTADAGEIWRHSVDGIVAVPGIDDSQCPHYFWSAAVPPDVLGAMLGLSSVREVRVLSRGPSERVTKIAFHSASQAVTMTGNELRKALGAQRLRSTLFRVYAREKGQPRWVFQGSGNGHGVGMSQWGARTMAEEGASFREILATFFPRLELTRR